jgi:hypothetical protein
MVTLDALRLPAVAVVLGVLEVPFSTVRVSARQLTVLRALDATRPITYFIAAGSGRTGFRSSDRQLAVWAFEAWQRNAVTALRFEPASESAALVRLYWAEPAEGQYGEMQPLVVDGRPGAAVFIRPDMDSLGQDIARRPRRRPSAREHRLFDVSARTRSRPRTCTHPGLSRRDVFFRVRRRRRPVLRPISCATPHKERHCGDVRAVAGGREPAPCAVRAEMRAGLPANAVVLTGFGSRGQPVLRQRGRRIPRDHQPRGGTPDRPISVIAVRA